MKRFSHILSRDPDHEWQQFGKIDPYYGVLSDDQFRGKQLTREAEAQFWTSGEKYFSEVNARIHEHLVRDFAIHRALDFGCGVGRVLIPIAQAADEAVGVDISPAMLDEARQRCASLDLHNVTFALSDDALTQVSGTFNFIHSFIVFQHIPIPRGERILRRLIDLLDDGGVGAVQFAYARLASPINQFLYYTVKSSALLSGLWNLYRGRAFNYPVMQMNRYDLNRLSMILQEKGCHNVHLCFTNHSGKYCGVLLLFQKQTSVISGVE